ncbi:MAG TPA: VWA domain-containing protein, partial [Paludibacter sp.]|nr:VWA domain-containing protein [Paludibacter sp.]
VSQYKMDIFTEVAAVLAFSTIHNNDKVGVIFFSDKIEKFIPPKKGRKHVLHIIREMIDFKPESKQTDIAEALRYFTNAIKKRSTAFIISDFIGHDFEKELTIANKKHDVVALQVYDIRETEIPDVGLIKLKDSETEQRIWVDTSDKRLRLSYKHGWAQSQLELQKTFTKSGVDFVSMSTSDDYVRTLIKLFKMRS